MDREDEDRNGAMYARFIVSARMPCSGTLIPSLAGDAGNLLKSIGGAVAIIRQIMGISGRAHVGGDGSF